MLQLMREGCSYTYPPLSIDRYSFIQLSELEQHGVKKLAQCFNTAAQDLNPGSRSRESEALPLSHCALSNVYLMPHIHLGVAQAYSGHEPKIASMLKFGEKCILNIIIFQQSVSFSILIIQNQCN